MRWAVNLIFSGVLAFGFSSFTALQAEQLPLMEEPLVPAEPEQMKGVESRNVGELMASTLAGEGGLHLMEKEDVPERELGESDLNGLIGSEITDRHGETLGQVEGVLANDAEIPVALLVRGGGFLGLGGRQFMIPLADLTADHVQPDLISLPIARSQVADLPDYAEEAKRPPRDSVQ